MVKKVDITVYCPHCGKQEYYTNGITRGTQRYFCKRCRCNFIKTTCKKRRYTPEVKMKALKLHLGGMSYRKIADSYRVQYPKLSCMTISNWIRKLEDRIKGGTTTIKLYELSDFEARQLNSLYHYLVGKQLALIPRYEQEKFFKTYKYILTQLLKDPFTLAQVSKKDKWEEKQEKKQEKRLAKKLKKKK